MRRAFRSPQESDPLPRSVSARLWDQGSGDPVLVPMSSISSALLGGGGMPSNPASRWKASPQSPAQMPALLAAFPDSFGGPGAGAFRGASAPH